MKRLNVTQRRPMSHIKSQTEPGIEFRISQLPFLCSDHLTMLLPILEEIYPNIFILVSLFIFKCCVFCEKTYFIKKHFGSSHLLFMPANFKASCKLKRTGNKGKK